MRCSSLGYIIVYIENTIYLITESKQTDTAVEIIY